MQFRRRPELHFCRRRFEEHCTKFSKSRQRTIKIRAGRYSECAVRAAPVEARLWPGKIQQHNIGTLLRSFEDNFTAAWRDVEVANVEVETDIGQLPLGARNQVDDPKIRYVESLLAGT